MKINFSALWITIVIMSVLGLFAGLVVYYPWIMVFVSLLFVGFLVYDIVRRHIESGGF